MITTHALTKSYGHVQVVKDVSFTCEPGTVTGFLGRNGAGKSTTLRMVTGLTRPDVGRATVDGHPFHELANPARVVGTLLDASAVHVGRTGRGTLRIAAELCGMPARRVDEVLDVVGLAGSAADRRVGTYSLGMRQRLGLAQALVGDPRILVLDEPANGLDPEGIAWMRGLLRDFADGGGTVLLSSHLLAEVQATVDRLVVIGSGRVLAQGSLSGLLASSGVVVRATDGVALHHLLARNAVPHRTLTDGSVVIDGVSGMDCEHVARLAAQAGVLLVELRASEGTGLEELFFSLTRDADTSAEGSTDNRELAS